MKYKQPLISVILPVYNVERYVKECMDSILNQTIQDFEVIVIDDCSTDNTIAVVESYDDDRISIIKKEANKGLIDSLNLGFRLSEGKYIARVDGDDINVLNRFEKQLLFLETNPEVKACGCWLQIYDDPSKVIKHKEWHEEITTELLLKCPMSLGATMLNKEAYLSFSFDKSKKHVEDYDFWARTAWYCKMHNLQEVLYYYRLHAKQVSSLYNHIQKEHDIEIKLYLFKKIQYDQAVFSDRLITKILLFDQYFKVRELSLFFKWLNNLKAVNKKEKVFDHTELINVLAIIKNQLLNKIYFKKSNLGITKYWRLRALIYLNFSDWIWLLNLKSKEFFKMEEKSRTNNNKFGLSFLRVLSTFSIVVIHVSGPIVNDYDNANLFNWNIANIFDAFSRYAVPMFFMISGALLLNKQYSLNVFLNKRIKKIMFPFLFWSITYSLLNRYVFKSESLNIVKNIKDVFYGSEYHLWFIYTLLGVYLITPILNKWIKSSSKVEIRYFLVIWFITLIISIPGLNIYFPKINLVYFSGYVGYFVLGYFLYYWTTSSKWLAIRFILSGGLVTVFGTAFFTVKESAFYYYFYEYLNLNTCLVSIGVFILFNKLKGVNQSFDALINKISDQTFGVFLIHPLVLKLFLLLKINVMINNSLIYIPMVTILCFFVSYFSVLGLKYLRFGNYIS